MADPRRRSALAGHYFPGAFGGDGRDGAGVVLRERRPETLIQINGASSQAQLRRALDDLTLQSGPEPESAGADDEASLIWNGPGMWLVDAPRHGSAESLASLRTALAGSEATVTDISHARTVIRVKGPNARDLLATGCPVDIGRFRSGDCAATLLGHLSVLVNAVDDGFDIYVFRSFGLALWEWLLRSAEEFGYQVI